MAKKAAYQRVIADFIERPLPEIIPRALSVPEDVPKIVSLLGPRRAGKTYMLFDVIRRLRQRWPAHRMVYVNFEDDRLFPAALSDLDGLLQGYYEMYPGNRHEKVWFFFDEIQEVDNWEKFVRRLADTENCRIFITGSSSKLLSRELASSLRGRTLPYEVFPLSYAEFLSFNQVQANPHSSQGKALIMHWLERYLRQGGYPELVFLPENLHRRTVNEYLDLMLYRDIAERFAVKNVNLLKYILKFLITNLANPISLRKVFQDLKSQGMAVGINTVHDYTAYLEEAFALFRVDIWSRSLRKQASNPHKFYAIDTAFKYAMAISEDIGRVFENVVFLELRRKGHDLHYFLRNQEIDFYWEHGELINACYSLDQPQTRKRELDGLIEAMNFLDHKESQLITWQEEGEMESQGRKIRIVPLWKFLLQ